MSEITKKKYFYILLTFADNKFVSESRWPLVILKVPKGALFENSFNTPGHNAPLRIYELFFFLSAAGVLLQPNISFSSMVSEPLGDPQLQQGALLFRGYSFTFTCSVKPQYPGGHFSLIFNQSSSISKPAVNHTAHFRFDAADENHRGNYSCVYYNSVLDLDFSSRSKSFSVGLQGKKTSDI